jgi:hypothetical protein
MSEVAEKLTLRTLRNFRFASYRSAMALIRFTDYFAQQSCTAGRAAFITGQHPFLLAS